MRHSGADPGKSMTGAPAKRRAWQGRGRGGAGAGQGRGYGRTIKKLMPRPVLTRKCFSIYCHITHTLRKFGKIFLNSNFFLNSCLDCK